MFCGKMCFRICIIKKKIVLLRVFGQSPLFSEVTRGRNSDNQLIYRQISKGIAIDKKEGAKTIEQRAKNKDNG